jgi:hypothetical protein
VGARGDALEGERGLFLKGRERRLDEDEHFRGRIERELLDARG